MDPYLTPDLTPGAAAPRPNPPAARAATRCRRSRQELRGSRSGGEPPSSSLILRSLVPWPRPRPWPWLLIPAVLALLAPPFIPAAQAAPSAKARGAPKKGAAGARPAKSGSKSEPVDPALGPAPPILPPTQADTEVRPPAAPAPGGETPGSVVAPAPAGDKPAGTVGDKPAGTAVGDKPAAPDAAADAADGTCRNLASARRRR